MEIDTYCILPTGTIVYSLHEIETNGESLGISKFFDLADARDEAFGCYELACEMESLYYNSWEKCLKDCKSDKELGGDVGDTIDRHKALEDYNGPDTFVELEETAWVDDGVLTQLNNWLSVLACLPAEPGEQSVHRSVPTS